MDLVIENRISRGYVHSNKSFTEPNQAYSVRQIIEQYSRGEVFAKSYQQTDAIDEGLYSEEQMEHVIDFEDDFCAFAHLQANQYEREKPTRKDHNKGLEEPSKGSEEGPKEETNGGTT